jgi:hypothetical protein
MNNNINQKQQDDRDVVIATAETKPETLICATVEYDESTGDFHLSRKPFKGQEEQKLMCLFLKIGDIKIAREAAEAAISKGQCLAKIQPGSIPLEWEDEHEKFTGVIFFAKVFPGLMLTSFRHDENYPVAKIDYSALMQITKVTMLTKHCVDMVFKKFIQKSNS